MESLKKEVLDFCKVQYKKGCSPCELHSVCAVNYPVTRYHIDKHVIDVNNKFKSLNL